MITNCIKAKIDKRKRLCDDRGQTLNHIISECSKLARKESMSRYDWI